VGQYIQPGETIARLEAMEQILVNFSVPQKFISQLTVGQPIAATVDAWPEQRFAGTIRAIDPQINRDTRMLKLQGTLDNPDGRLMPGMFARVKIALEQRNDVHTVPQAAIAYSPSGDSVYVVSAAPDDATALAVRSVFVVSGDRRGDQIEIISGLQAGMTVVTAGQQKLHNGARVVVDNSVPVSNQPAPAVENN
jgi:membrane fusion protein (multidrug efflux system)